MRTGAVASRSPWVSSMAAALSLLACTLEREPDPLADADLPSDASEVGDGDREVGHGADGKDGEDGEVDGDAARPIDATETTTDAVAPDLDVPCLDDDAAAPDLVIGRHYDLELADTVVSGELIAVYDHSRWWKDPTDETTLALFDAGRFADWPDDRSVVFVERSRVIRATESAVSAAPFRAWCLERGLGFAVPLDRPAWVMAGHERHHLEENGFGDYAYDLGIAEAGGRRWSGDGLDLADYWSWDVPAQSPVSGFVVEIERDHPDLPVGLTPDLDAPENLVGLWLAGGYHAYTLHHRQGSLPTDLTAGDFVEVGAPLGRIGNSGTSLEPHLHVVLLFWDHTRDRYWSLPVDFHDVHVAAAPTGSEARLRVAPPGGMWVSNAPF